MPSLKFVIFFYVLISIEPISGQTVCETTTELGTISETAKLPRLGKFNKCWTIKVPADKYAKVEVTRLAADKQDVVGSTLTIGNQILKPPQTKFPTVSVSDVNITFSAENSRIPAIITFELVLNYQVESLICAQANAFRCNETKCIPRSEVCNGVQNCENGADEKDCGGINEPEGAKESREKTLQLLKSLEFRRGGWGDDTPEVFTAIHLSNNTNFNVDLEEKLLSVQLQMQIFADSDPTTKKLGQYINVLKAVCADPKNFYSKDLVKLLNDKAFPVNFSDDSNGLVYLALCNAQTNLNAYLEKIEAPLKSTAKFDENQYYSALTVACMNRTDPNSVATLIPDLRTLIDRLKGLQKRDGSFDSNVTLSAQILQTIMASNILDGDWSYQDAIGYLMKEMEKSPKDIPTITTTLPLLARKTLLDIKCNTGSRKVLDEFMITDVKELILRYKTLDVENDDDVVNEKEN